MHEEYDLDLSLAFNEVLAGASRGKGKNMAKWADYCISGVRFNDKHTHIDKVRRLPDNGDSLGSSSEVSRQTVISELKDGTTYVTIFKDENQKWKKGRAVFIVSMNGVDYIKTVADNTTKDNLDELPEF
jgi:hypothetical protein